MQSVPVAAPNWQSLYDTAASQEGLFTTRQAAAAGYSDPLLAHYQKVGRIARIRRGIYRLVHFPSGEQEELVTAWLWTEAIGVLSHQTALTLQGLSDVLPAQIHLTLPLTWRQRRLRVPKGLVLHYADVPLQDRSWNGAVPVTSTRRTLWTVPGLVDTTFRPPLPSARSLSDLHTPMLNVFVEHYKTARCNRTHQL